ncbi:MAG: adenosylmethionine--8-amino-7-oxononanoate transaminase [Candidatus Omnitrophota bacterium]|nr:adenosylmethionine--8-amino-7-oxononanoate transaminase [Candidatus Omnitrophota bacterium]
MNKWICKDLKFNWHPYTQMKDCENLPPVLIERAKGVKLYGSRGRFYYDTISSWWCNVHGHNHPKIKRAVKKQLDSMEHILFAGFTHKPAILLAEKLISIAPKGLTRVFFSDNGSTSVEVALKMSFQYWRITGKTNKTRFIALDHGYHGDTIGAMSVSGESLFNEAFSPMLFPSFKVPSPYCYRCPMGKDRSTCEINCVNPLEKLLKEKSKDCSAIIIEPLVLAAGGMIAYPVEYLSKVADLAGRYNVHLILDEVATGFGRTGKMFACQHLPEINPDFLCLSKGITGGYLPMGATLTTKGIYQAFYADYGKKKTFYHGHTYTANPVACSAALASINIFDEEKTLDKVKKIIPLFQGGLQRFKGLPLVGDTRGIGLIGAMELVKDKRTRKAFDFKDRIGLQVYIKGLKKNIILRPLGGVIYLFLPLCIKTDELEDVMDRAYSVIKSL